MGIINYCSSETEVENDNCSKNGEQTTTTTTTKTTFKSYYWTQLISGLSIYFLCINHGVNSAWTSPALPYLSNRTDGTPISNEQGAWIASIPSFGIMFGTLICPPILDQLGRKQTTFISIIPALASWLMIIFTKNYIVLYVARFINGVGSGITYSAATLYFAEIATKNIRGIMITTINVCSNFGTLLIVTIGAFLNYETMNIAMTFLPLLALFTIPLMLETPYFLLMMEKDKSALKILLKLRGANDNSNEEVHLELERMKLSVDESRTIVKSSFRELFDIGNRRGLVILLFSTAAMYLSGISVFEAYAEEIFTYSHFPLKAKYSTIVLGWVRIVSGLLSTLFIDRGRKLMFLISGTLSSFALTSVGFFYFIDSKTDFDTTSLTWIPLIGLVLYLVFANLGLVTIPSIFMGELFTIKVKGKAVAIGIIYSAFFMFISKFWFQKLKTDFGIHVPFAIFAVCCLFFTFIVFWITPETSGKNLEEVQHILKQAAQKKKKKKKVILENWELASTSK